MVPTKVVKAEGAISTIVTHSGTLKIRGDNAYQLVTIANDFGTVNWQNVHSWMPLDGLQKLGSVKLYGGISGDAVYLLRIEADNNVSCAPWLAGRPDNTLWRSIGISLFVLFVSIVITGQHVIIVPTWLVLVMVISSLVGLGASVATLLGLSRVRKLVLCQIHECESREFDSTS